ncbi:MAG: adenylate kinase [Oligoflexia bacterium]|nr:adenylate kinase [Oligoflexia bacterium]
MNIILFGAPGAGKGTQAKSICSKYNVQHISTGDLLRKAIKDETDLGLQAKSIVDSGALVPDDIVVGLIKEAIINSNLEGFLFDGFPRTINQAEALNRLFEEQDMNLEKAVFLEVKRSTLIDRLTGRRVCTKCGETYHISSKPTKVDGVCDVCGGKTKQRDDDKKDVIENRLNVYEKSTLPLKDFYQRHHKFVAVDGEGKTEEIFDRICYALKN